MSGMPKTAPKTGFYMYSKFIPDPALIDTCLLVKDVIEPSSVLRDGNYIRWPVTDDIIKYFAGLNYVTGNIYYHTTPYEVHTDVFVPDIGVNVLVPLEREESQKFIVFDQTYKGSTVWKPGDGNIEHRGANKIYHTKPCNTPVQGLTDSSCDIAEHLPEENDFYFGLSGSVIEWLPGEGLVFPATNLHATGKMNKAKYGLAMWFSNTVDEVCTIMAK